MSSTPLLTTSARRFTVAPEWTPASSAKLRGDHPAIPIPFHQAFLNLAPAEVELIERDGHFLVGVNGIGKDGQESTEIPVPDTSASSVFEAFSDEPEKVDVRIELSGASVSNGVLGHGAEARLTIDPESNAGVPFQFWIEPSFAKRIIESPASAGVLAGHRYNNERCISARSERALEDRTLVATVDKFDGPLSGLKVATILSATEFDAREIAFLQLEITDVPKFEPKALAVNPPGLRTARNGLALPGLQLSRGR